MTRRIRKVNPREVYVASLTMDKKGKDVKHVTELALRQMEIALPTGPP